MSKVIRTLLFSGVFVGLTACNQPSPTTPPKTGGGDEKPKETGKKAVTKSTGSKATSAANAEGPIAKVNGVAIDRGEFDAKFTKMTKAFTTRKKEIPAGLAKRYRQSILKQLVDKELLRQKIESAGVKIEDADLAKELVDYKKMFRTEDNFQRYLKSSSISLDQIKGNISHNLAVQKLLEKEGGLAITDEAVKEYYEKNQSRYEVKEQIRASHILFKVSSKDDKAADKAAKQKATKAFKEAGKPNADFAALAKKHSEGPTASRGGDLSYFNRGRMVPEFEKVAFTMKVGDVSKPLRTQFGWHVIKVTDRKEGRKRPFDEVKESISKLLRNKKSRKAKADLLKTLKETAKIERFLPEPAPEVKKAAAKPGSKAPAAKKPAPAKKKAPAANGK